MNDPMICPVCGGPKWPADRTCSDKCSDRLVVNEKDHTYTIIPEEGSNER